MRLNKYSKELTTYRKQGGLPQGDIKNELADIYEEMWPNHKNWGASKIKRNCVSCIGDMMKSLCAHWESSLKEFKGVPDKLEVKLDIKATPSDEVVEDMKQYWGKELSKEAQIAHLKQQCKERGIEYHHKAGVKKLTELLS